MMFKEFRRSHLLIFLQLLFINYGMSQSHLSKWQDSAVYLDYKSFLAKNSSLDGNVFLGEFHSAYCENDLVLRDMINQISHQGDTIYLMLEISPTIVRMVYQYIDSPSTERYNDVKRIDRDVSTAQGWLPSKLEMLERNFKRQIIEKKIIIKGIDEEEYFQKTPDYVSDICKGFLTTPKSIDKLDYLKWKSDHNKTVYADEVLDLVSAIDTEFTQRGTYSRISLEDSIFLNIELQRLRQANHLRSWKYYNSKVRKQREDYLYSNFCNELCCSKSKRVLTLVGIDHVSRQKNNLYWNTLVQKLVESKFIPVDHVIGIIPHYLSFNSPREYNFKRIIPDKIRKQSRNAVWKLNTVHRFYDCILVP